MLVTQFFLLNRVTTINECSTLRHTVYSKAPVKNSVCKVRLTTNLCFVIIYRYVSQQPQKILAHAFSTNVNTIFILKRAASITQSRTMRRKKWQSKLCGGFLAVLTVYLYLQFSKLCIKNIFFTENSDDSKIPLDSFLSDSLVSEKNVNLDLDQKEHAKNGQTLLKHNKGETKNSDGVDEKVLGDSSKNSNASNGLSCQELKALLKATKLQNHSQLR